MADTPYTGGGGGDRGGGGGGDRGSKIIGCNSITPVATVSASRDFSES